MHDNMVTIKNDVYIYHKCLLRIQYINDINSMENDCQKRVYVAECCWSQWRKTIEQHKIKWKK